MASDIHHRGPDDEGYAVEGWAGFGFKRLSILDQSPAAHQPMRSADGRYIIVYNGELYNFCELRSELISQGVEFRSTGDTEVILNAYRQWGKDCVERFTGMFAFIILDTREKKAFVARDHLGIKPLYLLRAPGSLYFASEIKAFRQVTRFEVNQAALYEQFVFRYVAGERTLFADVERVKPGTWMEISQDGQIAEEKYHDLTSALSKKRRPFDEEEVRSKIIESIVGHTVSDVGYNIQLSGGIDSSYITAVLADKLGSDISTYSVSLDSKLDEGPYQRQVAEQFGTQHRELRLGSSDLADSYFRFAWHMDMPVIHVACPLLMLLCDTSRENSKVILTGEGADELFCGYSRFDISQQDRVLRILRRYGFPFSALPSFGKFRTLKKLGERDPVVYAQRGADPDRISQLVPGLTRNIEFREKVAGRYPSYMDAMIASDQECYLQSMLERQDRASMASSVEARVPFCTQPLYELVNSIDSAEKIKGDTLKYILKKLSSDYFDDQFIHRRKRGFTLPLADWLRKKEGIGQFLDFLTDRTFAERGLYDTKNVQGLIDQHLKGTIDASKELFVLINFEIWHRIFIDQSISPSLKPS